MILSAHQPAYIPWLGYFDKMRKCDAFVILDDVQFERGSFVNRNRIAGPTWLTIPLKMKGHMTKTIRQMEVAESWFEDHAAMLEEVYKKAPHFHDWLDKWLWEAAAGDNFEHACHFSKFIARELGIQTEMYLQSAHHITGHKLGLIVNLCRHYGADSFLFGAEGYEAYGKGLAEYGITPLKHTYTPPDVPALSVMHYLMTIGTEGTRRLICG